MTDGPFQSTAAVEIPPVRFFPIVVGSIAALAVVGFILGLKAADDGGSTIVSASDAANAATLAGAPLASPITLNAAETEPPAPEPVKTEEVKTAEEPAPPEAPPVPPVTAPTIIAPTPAAPAPAAAATADSLY